MSSMLKTLALIVLLLVITSSLQGCGGCDKEAAEKCSKDNAGSDCDSVQKGLDCLKDCCDEKLKDLDDTTPEAMGDKTVKDAMVEMMSCALLLSPALSHVRMAARPSSAQAAYDKLTTDSSLWQHLLAS